MEYKGDDIVSGCQGLKDLTGIFMFSKLCWQKNHIKIYSPGIVKNREYSSLTRNIPAFKGITPNVLDFALNQLLGSWHLCMLCMFGSRHFCMFQLQIIYVT